MNSSAKSGDQRSAKKEKIKGVRFEKWENYKTSMKLRMRKIMK
jgi:hypothetical protein